MYESPINAIMGEMQLAYEGEILKAVRKCNIIVDKEELVKALNYDRDQYKKGYEDGKKAAQQWITCSERLPNSNGCYLVWRPHFFGGEIGMPSICYFDGQNTWHDSYGVDFERVLSSDDVTAWMPLPEPMKGDEA